MPGAQQSADEEDQQEDQRADGATEIEREADHEGEQGRREESEQLHRREIYSAVRVSAMNPETASMAAPASAASATARTSRVPMITPSAIMPTAAACSGVPIP